MAIKTFNISRHGRVLVAVSHFFMRPVTSEWRLDHVSRFDCAYFDDDIAQCQTIAVTISSGATVEIVNPLEDEPFVFAQGIQTVTIQGILDVKAIPAIGFKGNDAESWFQTVNSSCLL